MKNLILLTVGIGLGFVVAHQVNKTTEGQKFFAGVDTRAKEFSSAVVEGYKTREAELHAAVADAEGVIADLRAQA